MKQYKKGDTIYVAGSGQRGNHGCCAEAEVRLTATPGAANDRCCDWRIEGVIVSARDCEQCGESWPELGTHVVLEGWYNPEYYGHDGLQL